MNEYKVPKLEDVAERVLNQITKMNLDTDTFVNICVHIESLSCNYNLLESECDSYNIEDYDERAEMQIKRRRRIIEIIANLYHLILS